MRASILKFLRNNPPSKPKAIADGICQQVESVSRVLRGMVAAKTVRSSGNGFYSPGPVALVIAEKATPPTKKKSNKSGVNFIPPKPKKSATSTPTDNEDGLVDLREMLPVRFITTSREKKIMPKTKDESTANKKMFESLERIREKIDGSMDLNELLPPPLENSGFKIKFLESLINITLGDCGDERAEMMAVVEYLSAIETAREVFDSHRELTPGECKNAE